MSAEMFERHETELDFLNRVIPGDESWFQMWPLTQEAEWGMAHATVSKTEESSHEQIKNQDNDTFLLFSQGSS
jgi:hypothetical protein